VFAVPGTGIAGQAVEAGTMYPLQLRLVHRDPGEEPAFLDTTRLFLTGQPLGPAQYLTGLLEVPVREGLHDLRAVLMDPDGGAGDIVDIDSVQVPEFGAPGLVMSDLVLGDTGSGLVWRPTGGDAVPLSPLAAYPVGGSLELYYEVHGLEPGRPYRARIEVRGKRSRSIFARIGRLFGGGGPAVTVAFDAVAASRHARARQTVGLEQLGPGEYTLTLMIEDPEGDARHRRDVRFRVTDR
jgi:hypothetical protein